MNIKKTITTVVLTAYIAFLAPAVFAKSVTIETSSFDKIYKTINQKITKESKDTLVVMDIDNTILTASSDLGGDIWYQWQTGKLEVKPKPEDKVTNLYGDAIYLLYSLMPMNLVEQSIPSKIKSWQDKGVTVFALTSRSPENFYSTKRELLKYGVDFSINALKEKGSSINPVYKEKLKRELVYADGLMLTSGQNKGLMLEYILKRTGKSFKNIIFIDDSKKNVLNVSSTFKNKPSVNVEIFYYTKIEKDRIKKNGSVLTQKQADKMAKDWKELITTISRVYPARNKSKEYTK